MRRILGHYMATSWLLLGVVETSLIAVGCCAAFYFLFSDPSASAVSVAPFAVLLSLGIVVLMHSGGLYDGEGVVHIKRTLWRVAVIAAPIFLLAVWTTGELARHAVIRIYPYRWQWTFALTGLWLFSTVLLRVLFRQVLQSGLLTRRVVLVGMESHAAEIADLVCESQQRFRLVGQFSGNDDIVAAGSPATLALLTSKLGASEVVIAVGGKPLPWTMLANCRVSGIRVTDFLDFYEREGRRICIESLREDWIALSNGFEVAKSNDRLRRLTDVLLALAGFVATAPVLLLAAVAIKLEDGGPVFYRQERIGLAGHPFTLFKFRSMHHDAERDGKPAWAAEHDLRITSVGAFIRKVRIDELPQFWNVLRGDMTLIGPRPERPYFVQRFSQSIPFYDYRHMVRPGITGWAQVRFRYGASIEDARKKLSYDLYYIKNRGILLDIVILLKTVGVVLRCEGAR